MIGTRQNSFNEGRQVAKLVKMILQNGVGGEPIQQAAQAARENELARRTVGAGFPAAQTRQKTHLRIVQGQAEMKEESRRDPGVGHQPPDGFQVQHLDLFSSETGLKVSSTDQRRR